MCCFSWGPHKQAQALYIQEVKNQTAEAKLVAGAERVQEKAEELGKATIRHCKDPSEYNKKEMEKAQTRLEDEISEMKKSDISEVLAFAYENYVEFVSNLTPDKLVCLFNMIVNGLLLTSFTTVLSIMLSDSIINRITFLEKYPRLLKLLRLRNNISRKVSKFYLLFHLILILAGLILNIFMFFL